MRDGVELEYTSYGPEGRSNTVVFLPGLGGRMRDFLPEMQALHPVRSITIGRRGMESPTVPTKGYGFNDQVDDAIAVMNSLHLHGVTILAHSAGVPCAVAIATSKRDVVHGLVLLDHVPVYPKLTDRWLQANLSSDRTPQAVVHGLFNESTRVDLWNELSSLDCPILVIRGGLSNFISDTDVQRFRDSGSNVVVVTFENSGHDISKPFPTLFHSLLADFVGRLPSPLS